MKVAIGLLATVLLVGVAHCLPVSDLYNSQQNGDLTYYGPTNAGNCGIRPRPSWYPAGVTYSAALNANQYASDALCAGCGVCLRGNWLGTGLGLDPPQNSFTALIVDQCPGCARGDIDINNDFGGGGDGRWQIEWQAIDCPVGNTKLQWQFEGSNDFFIKLGVRNYRVAVTKLEVKSKAGQSYVTATRTQDNFFTCDNCAKPFEFPMPVRVTGVNGEVLEDVVPRLETQNNKPMDGSNAVQFSVYRPDPGAGNTGSTSSTSSQRTTTTTTTRSRTTTTTAATTTKTGTGTGTTSTTDNSGNGNSGCFAAESIVRVNSNGHIVSKPLRELMAGELVESVSATGLQREFSPVYYVAHRRDADDQATAMLQLTFAEQRTVRLTANHLLYAAANLLEQPALVHAKDVAVGQFVFVLDSDQAQPVQVTAVDSCSGPVRNPLTVNSRIVVDGVACSVFVESQPFYAALTSPLVALAQYAPALFTEHSWFALLLDQLVRFTDYVESLPSITSALSFSS